MCFTRELFFMHLALNIDRIGKRAFSISRAERTRTKKIDSKLQFAMSNVEKRSDETYRWTNARQQYISSIAGKIIISLKPSPSSFGCSPAIMTHKQNTYVSY